MPSFQRILGSSIVLILVSGLAYGQQGKETAPTYNVPGSVPPSAKAVPPVTAARPSQVVRSLNNLPMRFEANQGQADERVEFLSRGQGYTLFLTGEEAVLSLAAHLASNRQTTAGENPKLETGNAKSKIQYFPASDAQNLAPSLIRMKLQGARAGRATGLDLMPSKSNYFLGNDPKRWRTGVPNYARIKYEDVYPGIDLVYYGNQRQLEYDFVVAPGADPKEIRFAIDTGTTPSRPSERDGTPLLGKEWNKGWLGASSELVRIESNGDLVVSAGKGAEARFHKPRVYQMVDGRRHEIDARYALRPAEDEARNPKSENRKSKTQNSKYEVAFELASYDPTLSLVIDPVLSYSTLLGGANSETGYGVGADNSGNIIAVGTTFSVNFPTQDAVQPVASGSLEIYITKVDPTSTTLVFSTYLGGSGADQVSGMVLDASGNIFIAGTTTSPNFPTTSTAFQPSFGGGTCGTDLCSDAFVAKIKSDGTGFVYATFLGGNKADTGAGLAVDGDGNAYVVGSTDSANFPTASAIQAASGGTTDAFLTKVKPDGTGLVYSTYLGGSSIDIGQAVAVDSGGNAYVTGYTVSMDFPTVNPLQSTNKGLSDVFIAKINPAGDTRIFSTYLGGADSDRARAIAVDPAGNVYVGGDTSSADFPVSAAPFQAALAPGTCGALPCPDGFLAKLDPSGATALYSTYLGGTDLDQILGIAVNGTGEAFVTGSTSSSDFPLHNPMQAVIGGGTCSPRPCSDAFITRVDPTGSMLVYSTFLGGNGSDTGQAIFVDGSDNAFVTGFAGSTNFPATPGAYQTTPGGTSSSGDAFVAEIGPADASGLVISPLKLTFADQPQGFTSGPLTITLTNVGTAPVTFAGISVTGDFAQTNTCEPSLAVGSATCTISVTFAPTTIAALTGELTITSDASGSPHKIAITGSGIAAKSKLEFSPTTVTFPDQDVSTTSAPIAVTVSNTGFADITITTFAVTGDYAQTNNCPVSPSKLVIGGSCTVDITFTPTGSGGRSGTFSITSDAGNAGGGLNTLSLSGTGIAPFTISAPISAVTIKRGTTTAKFSINALGPSSFTGDLTLACQSGVQGTCTFAPTSIKVGESSTLTLSGLDLVTVNTFTFTVRATNNLQFAQTMLTLTFSDYSFALPNPTFGTVAPGDSFVVKLTLNSKDGFDGSASFSCSGLPQESSCTFNPTTATLDGTNPATVDVTIKTTTRVTTWAPPRPPSTQNPWRTWGLGVLVLLLVLGASRLRIRLLVLAGVLLALIFVASCNDYYYYTYTGTLPGTFPIVVTAKVGTVSHTTTFYLTVL